MILKVDNSVIWTDDEPLSSNRLLKLRRYASRFVMESEAIGATKQTNGFIKDLSISTTQRVRSFIRSLSLDYDVLYAAVGDPEKLTALLQKEKLDGKDYIEAEVPFCFFVFSGLSVVSKQVNELKEFRSGEAKKSGSAKQNKSEFYRLDCLFRHLRNSIAHGQYKCLEKVDKEPMWAFQDSNSRGVITARMVLPESILDSWEQLIYSRDRRYRS